MLLLFSRGGGGPTTPIPTPTYTLSWWQEIEFQAVVDLWEPTRTSASDGDLSAPIFVKRWQNVPCFERHNRSAGDPELMGRIEQQDFFTRAEYHFHQYQEIGDTWAIVLKTIDLDGNRHPDYGKVWVCTGEPEIFVNQWFDEGFQRVVAQGEEIPPEGVS